VEQPELHLHPAWQAKLASVIWRAMTEWKPFRLQIVLETHSEHFVRRLQRMIRAYPEKYRPEDVALVSVYRENMTGTSHIKRIGLDERGRFQGEWPEDFFPEHNQELFDPYEEKQKAEDWMRGGYMEEIS
jgi:predicted ATPase